MYRIDLHTHSLASPDGSLTADDYRQLLDEGRLGCIAVTDHNETTFARDLHAALGDRIIIGEEVMTSEGEIIGLYLTDTIRSGLSPAETIRHIHEQQGLVYIPHPFEHHRKGLSSSVLAALAADIDIIETINGRAMFENRSPEAQLWAEKYQVVGAASSDAHGFVGWGKTATVVSAIPTRQSLVSLLQHATYETHSPGLRAVLYPTYNRLRRKKNVEHHA